MAAWALPYNVLGTKAAASPYAETVAPSTAIVRPTTPLAPGGSASASRDSGGVGGFSSTGGAEHPVGAVQRRACGAPP